MRLAFILASLLFISCKQAEPIEHAWNDNSDNLKKAVVDIVDSTKKASKPIAKEVLNKAEETIVILRNELDE